MREGRRLKSIDPFAAIAPFVMVERSDSQNSITDFFKVEGAEAFIRELRKEGYDSIGFLHVLIAAYVRMLAKYPKINRFIRGQRIYSRYEIVINMAIKRTMTIDENETTIKMHFKPSDTIFDVYNEVNRVLKKAYEAETDTDSAARVLNYTPRLMKKLIMWNLKLLDYFDLLPSALIEASPFHGSMFLTNVASLNIPPVRHHLYNFGNVPVFIAFGAKRNVERIDKDGNVIRYRVIDFIANLDDRTCEGFYYAQAMKQLKRLIENPEVLREAPEKIEEDVR